MGRIVVTEYMSLDGVVEAPSGTEEFERIGWTDGFSRGPEGDQFKVDETMAADAQLLGRTLIEHDLVDALNLLVYPVIVGAGKRLFDGTSETKRLRLAEARTFGDGVQLLVYERGGE